MWRRKERCRRGGDHVCGRKAADEEDKEDTGIRRAGEESNQVEQVVHLHLQLK
jgi:general stress protein YciG